MKRSKLRFEDDGLSALHDIEDAEQDDHLRQRPAVDDAGMREQDEHRRQAGEDHDHSKISDNSRLARYSNANCSSVRAKSDSSLRYLTRPPR